MYCCTRDIITEPYLVTTISSVSSRCNQSAASTHIAVSQIKVLPLLSLTFSRKAEWTSLKPEHQWWNLTTSPALLMWVTKWELCRWIKLAQLRLRCRRRQKYDTFQRGAENKPRGQKVDMAFKGCPQQNAEKKADGFTEMMEQPLAWPSVDVITPACTGCYETGCFFYEHLINKMIWAKINELK